ncbi:hypothetical protein BGX28_005088 [Mortierella sp. GBA30]|nr:hypothetical protein BGX28_005088 [Mortierella sp. GBA30]
MTSTHAALPAPTHATSEVLSQAMRLPGATYKLLYFPVHGRAELIRNILAYSGAKWEELPVEWPAMKTATPFQCIPVVYEMAPNGTVIELAEALAIERYLGTKFHLIGRNEYEHHKINQFLCSSDTFLSTFSSKVARGPREKQYTPEERIQETNAFYATEVTKFVAIHEEHLKKNGSNGHYVGNQITLADLKTAMLINRLLLFKFKGTNELPLSAEKAPNLWKLRETVNNFPGIAAWRQSQRHQELDNSTKGLFNIA